MTHHQHGGLPSYDEVLRWISRGIILLMAILAAGCLFSITGCMVVKPVVGTGITATKAAGKAVGATAGATVGLVTGGDDEPAADQ